MKLATERDGNQHDLLCSSVPFRFTNFDKLILSSAKTFLHKCTVSVCDII